MRRVVPSPADNAGTARHLIGALLRVHLTPLMCMSDRRIRARSRLSGRRHQLQRRGLRLEYATLGWNLSEIGFLAAAAVGARSVALAVTAVDGVLAAGILVGLILNAVAGLWWADPVAAAVVALFCVREAVENWREARSEPAWAD